MSVPTDRQVWLSQLVFPQTDKVAFDVSVSTETQGKLLQLASHRPTRLASTISIHTDSDFFTVSIPTDSQACF